jgi:hypothetical protein
MIIANHLHAGTKVLTPPRTLEYLLVFKTSSLCIIETLERNALVGNTYLPTLGTLGKLSLMYIT